MPIALRILASLMLMLAVVLLPSSSANAQIGAHDMPDEMQMEMDHASHNVSAEDPIPSHWQANLGVDNADGPHDQCCSGICFSALVQEMSTAELRQSEDEHDPSPLFQLAWAVTIGFLRPPNS